MKTMRNSENERGSDQSAACLICDRIALIRADSNPHFVAEMETGYVVLGDFHYWRGYTLFLCKYHVLDLHELEEYFRLTFLREMSEVAAAVFRAFRPHHLNYELLGNSEPHLHWHLFPRYAGEPFGSKPIWVVDKTLRYGETTRPNPEELAGMKATLLAELPRWERQAVGVEAVLPR